MSGDALTIYRRMLEMKVKPTVQTFGYLAYGYSSLEMYRDITILWGDIKRNTESGILLLSRDLYEFILLNFLRGGYFERVIEVIGFMKENTQQITSQLWRSWSVESRFFFVVVRRSSASLHSPVTILHSLQIAADSRSLTLLNVDFGYTGARRSLHYEKCDGKCIICDSYVRPCTLVMNATTDPFRVDGLSAVECESPMLTTAKSVLSKRKTGMVVRKLLILGVPKRTCVYERKKYGFKKR
ncbi:hypothetical protein LWI29_018832 [Acer saccharum]|uniref:Pentatricopeptide repeat-containing protein n=1 Tax=Acer saccharum TaxID=4024 RepID=A0AA39RYU6_ACESA|nr:hypothetical protein LWI29_018832 [Acer saccharum]